MKTKSITQEIREIWIKSQWHTVMGFEAFTLLWCSGSIDAAEALKAQAYNENHTRRQMKGWIK